MGRRTKPGLTMQRHRELGARLHELREELGGLQVELGHAYPYSSADRGRPNHWVSKAYYAVDMLRSALDTEMFREHPAEASVDVYYPGRGEICH